jgi:hypothetical protein
MLCPSCSAVVKKEGNFCSHCGCQVPIVVGEKFPFGIRFPAMALTPEFAAAVSQAKRAPRYTLQFAGTVRYHVALFDRPHVPDLAELYRMVYQSIPGRQPLVEHTTDGESFFSSPSFWSCFARQLTDGAVEFPLVAHAGCRCHSIFGCIAAQGRQHEMYHREGWEVFYNRRHGLFPGGDSGAFEDRQDRGGLVSLSSGDIDTTVFSMDRAKVKAEAMNMIRRAGGHRCPLFSPSVFEKAVRNLPQIVDVEVMPDWGFLNCTIHGPAVYLKCYKNEAEITVSGGHHG